MNLFSDIKKNLDIIKCCKEWLPTGKMQGNEWVSINPKRNDKSAGSFRINTLTGAWCDFACDNVRGGDMVSLNAYLHNIPTQYASAEALSGVKAEVLPVVVSNINTIMPIPKDALQLPFDSTKTKGHWVYTDKDANPILHLIRYDVNDGKKSILPYTYGQVGNIKKWFNKGIYRNGKPIKDKPLYNLHELYKRPTAPVLIVEGEKTADFTSTLLSGYVVITWLGGCSNAANANLEGLENRNIVLWPDNDEAGKKAMNIIKTRLKKIASSVYVANIKKMGILPTGWDLADADNLPQTLENVHKCLEMTKKSVINFPDLTEKGKPVNTTANLETLLEQNGIEVKYNEMTNYPEFYSENPEHQFSMVNKADCFFTEIGNCCLKAGLPITRIEDNVLKIAEKNSYHPARDLIESKPWDGVNRIIEFIKTIKTHECNSELAIALIYRWMIGCVAVLYNPEGTSLDGMLVIQGDQGIGKTRWMSRLVPEANKNLIKTGIFLNPQDKDSMMHATACWIGELGELEGTIRKSHVSYQKAYLTQSIDYYRVPYGKRIRGVPRKTAFFGSVNPEHFLADDTGNRRYWIIPAISIDYNHAIDMQQVWAQFKVLYDQGASYRLTAEERALMDKSNEDFELLEPLKEMLFETYDFEETVKELKTCTTILNEMGYEKPTRSELNKMSAILKNLKITKGEGRHRYDYLMPVPKKIKKW